MTPATPTPTPDATTADKPASKTWLRVGILALFLATAYAVAYCTGAIDALTLDNLRSFVQEAGWWGMLAFVVLFAVGNIVQVPGNVFVVAAALAYGQVYGIGIAWIGAIAAVAASFTLARTVGGQPLEGVKSPFMRKLLDRLDQRPILVMIVLRIAFMVSPPLNYALALSGMRFRDYMIGSIIGLLPPIAVVALLADWFAARLG